MYPNLIVKPAPSTHADQLNTEREGGPADLCFEVGTAGGGGASAAAAAWGVPW